MIAQTLFTDTTEDAPGPRAELVDPSRTIAFMLAGNAYVTFQSRRTGTRFTYRIQAAHGEGAFRASAVTHFVAVLTAPDHYDYLGCIFDSVRYAHGKKSRINEYAPSAVAFGWVWDRLQMTRMHPELAVYHEGRCGKCGRRLTTPESIETGLGPVCAGRISS